MSTRLEEAQVYKRRVQAARRALAGLYVTDDITRRHTALAMVLDIADSEIERVIEFERKAETPAHERTTQSARQTVADVNEATEGDGDMWARKAAREDDGPARQHPEGY